MDHAEATRREGTIEGARTRMNTSNPDFRELWIAPRTRTSRASAVAAGLAAFLILIASGAAAATLYGTIGRGGTISTLVELDPTTGALVQTIGLTGYTVNGLAWDATTGTLYASTTPTSTFHGLIVIDPATGVGTPVSASSGFGLGSSSVNSLTFDSSGQLYAWVQGFYDLVSIDKTTGLASIVGDAGIGITGSLGLAFDDADHLFLMDGNDGYYSVDPNTGAATFLSALPGIAHHGAFDPDTNLYVGIDAIQNGPKNLVQIEVDAAVQTIQGTLPTVNDLHTVAFVPEPAALVPVSLVLIGLGALERSRRRARR